MGMLKYREHTFPLGQKVSEVIAKVTTRKAAAEAFTKLSELCDSHLLSDPAFEIIQMGATHSPYYTGHQPHVLVQSFNIVVKMHGDRHCFNLHSQRALTDEPDFDKFGSLAKLHEISNTNLV
jgi:hypothetical protein